MENVDDNRDTIELELLLNKVYQDLCNKFNGSRNLVDVLNGKKYSSIDTEFNQKPEELVKQIIVEPLLKFLGYTLVRETSLKTPFGNRYPDYTLYSGDNIIYAEAEPINTNLYESNHGLSQVYQWLLSKAAKTEYGIATNGLEWILVKFDSSNNDTMEILNISLRSYFLSKIKSKNDNNETLLQLLDFKVDHVFKKINEYTKNAENKKSEISKKFYDEYVDYVFGEDEKRDKINNNSLIDSIKVKNNPNPKLKLFSIITMNRLIFIKFLEDKEIVNINLLTGLYEKYKSAQLSISFYDAYLKPLFYDILNKEPQSRVTDNEIYKKIPYLNGGLFTKIIPGEDEYDIENSSMKDIITWLSKYEIGIKSESQIRPDILGYVFEKTINHLSDTKTDKQKEMGAYYTPEYIVNYMIKNSMDKIIFEKMMLGLKKIGWKDTDLIGYNSIEDVLNNKPLNKKHIGSMLHSLDSLSILDPSCGSGHFLTSIANELTRIESSLYLAMGGNLDVYELKRKVISNNIYGIDLDENAVEITKLRLWLSIIGEWDKGKHTNLTTLPNIDFNIVNGNALIGLEELKITPYKILFSEDTIKEIIKKFQEIKNILTESEWKDIEDLLFNKNDILAAYQLLRSYYPFKSGSESKNLHNILTVIKEYIYDFINKNYYPTNNEEVFHWSVEFYSIMKNGGFDIIIGNPPYFDLPTDNPYKKLSEYREILKGTTNIASLFIKRSMGSLNHDGYLSFIIPKSYVYVNSWKPIRSYIYNNYQLLNVTNVGKGFKEVLLEQVIIVIKNAKQELSNVVNIIPDLSSSSRTKKVPYNAIIMNDIIPFTENKIVDDIKDKVLKDTCMLIDILGKDNIFTGLSAKNVINTGNIGFRILTGKEVQRFHTTNYNNYYIDNANIVKTDKAKKLRKYKKIIAQDIVAQTKNHIKITATYDPDGTLTMDTVDNFIFNNPKTHFLPKYILALLNSKIISFYAYNFIYSNAIRTMHFGRTYSGRIPIKIASIEEQEKIVNLVDKLLTNGQNEEENIKILTQIDQLVYSLYKLNDEEILYVESTYK